MESRRVAGGLWPFAVPVLAQVVNLLWVPGPWRLLLSNLWQLVAAGMFLFMAFRVWRAAKGRLGWEAGGRFWLVLAAGFWTLGMAGFMYIEVVESRAAYPAWPDGFFLLFYPFFALGLGRLAASEGLSLRGRPTVVWDLLLLALVTVLVLWESNLYRLLRGFWESSEPATRFSLAYVVLDGVLLVTVAALFLTGGGGLPRVSMVAVLGGFAALVVADMAQGLMAVEEPFVSGHWADLGWTLFGSLMALAGHGAVSVQGGGVSREGVASLTGFVLTYVWLAAVVFLLVRAVWTGPVCGSPAVLVTGAMAVLVAAAVRQSLAWVEKMRLAEELRRSNESLREEAAFKDRLLSVVGHDLKNPLQALLLSTELLRRVGSQACCREAEAVAEDIHVSTLRMSEVLDNLLYWGRSRSGRLEMRREPLEVGGLVEEALELFRPQVSAKRLGVRVGVESGVRVLADRQMASVVLRNLVSNAVKFVSEGGEVSVVAVRGSGWVDVAVEDSGPGLSEEDIRKLFDGAVSRATIGAGMAGKGSGLGLLLCKDFMERQGGSIRAERGVSGGLRVVARFPLAEG